MYLAFKILNLKMLTFTILLEFIV